MIEAADEAGVAFVTGVVGLGLFFAPEAVAPIWFWSLTPLLARMTAAWLTDVRHVCHCVEGAIYVSN